MQAEKRVAITNKLGLHVRPAAALSELASQYRSNVMICKNTHIVNAKSSIDLLTLAAIQGTVLVIKAEGEDAIETVNAIARLIEGKFGEE